MSNAKKRKLAEQPVLHNPLNVTCTHRNYDRLNKQRRFKTVTRTASVGTFVVPTPSLTFSFDFDGSGSTQYNEYVPSNPVTAASLGIKESEKKT